MSEEVLPGAPVVGTVAEESEETGQIIRPDQPYTTISSEQGEGGSIWTDAQRTSAYYTDVQLDVKYEFKPGWEVQTPMAADVTAGDKVKVHAGYWTKVVQWSYERMQDYPEGLPHWETDDDNEVLLHAEVIPAKPAEGPDGLRVYRISGLYVFRLLSGGPPFRFGTGVTPESIASHDDNALDVGAYFDRDAITRDDDDVSSS